jgi:hypothetical protein
MKTLKNLNFKMHWRRESVSFKANYAVGIRMLKKKVEIFFFDKTRFPYCQIRNKEMHLNEEKIPLSC